MDVIKRYSTAGKLVECLVEQLLEAPIEDGERYETNLGDYDSIKFVDDKIYINPIVIEIGGKQERKREYTAEEILIAMQSMFKHQKY